MRKRRKQFNWWIDHWTVYGIRKVGLAKSTKFSTKKTDLICSFLFTSKNRLVNINIALKTEQKIERETAREIEENRSFLIQAALVRIMKEHKVLTHQILVAEVLTQVAKLFKPKIPIIKVIFCEFSCHRQTWMQVNYSFTLFKPTVIQCFFLPKTDWLSR